MVGVNPLVPLAHGVDRATGAVGKEVEPRRGILRQEPVPQHIRRLRQPVQPRRMPLGPVPWRRRCPRCLPRCHAAGRTARAPCAPLLAGNAARVALRDVPRSRCRCLLTSESCLGLDIESAPLHGSAEGIEDSAAARNWPERHASWLHRLPKTPDMLWDWLLAQDAATRLDLLAYCAGCSVNAVSKRHERVDADHCSMPTGWPRHSVST